ncbi:MAG: SusC/RagA family TonB-linked outer membrane protein, partial [Bacteroidota bacterium]
MVGLGSAVTYGDVRLSFNFEYRGGNVMYSDLGGSMTFTGSGKWTENRGEQIFPNSYYIDGSGKEVPNTTVQVRQPEYALWVSNYRLIRENFVTPGWFIKLRDLNLSYSL